ncbi:MAG: glycosyltransferase family 39 protein [Pseudomonadota bacterium]
MAASSGAGGPARWSTRLSLVLLFVAALASLSVGIATIPVTDRDEARFAQASRQMAETGDFVDIRYQDVPRYKKPVGIYWAQAGVLRLLNPEEPSQIWMHRLPSLLAAALAPLLVVWAGVPLVGSVVALMAGGMMASVYLLYAEAHFAKTDAALLVAALGAMGALSRAWMGQVRGWAVPLVFWTSVAAGLLLKGPVVLAPVASVIVWVAVLKREVRWLLDLRPGPGLLWMLFLAGPWYVAISLEAGWAFWAESAGRDLAGKIAEGQENHGGPPGLYLLWLLMMGWPWVLVFPAAAVMAWRRRGERGMTFLIGWVVPFWVVLELVPTKLPHYPLPLYPALMCLGALAIRDWLGGERPVWPARIGALFWAIGLAWFLLLILGAPIWQGVPVPLVSVAGATGVVALAVAAALKARVAPGLSLVSVMGAAVLAFWAFLGSTLPALTPFWISTALAEATERAACLDGPVGLVGYHEPSAVFLLGQDTLLTWPDDLAAAFASGRIVAAWVPEDSLETTPGVEGANLVTGFNYNSGRDVALRLIEAPGTPAAAPVCP